MRRYRLAGRRRFAKTMLPISIHTFQQVTGPKTDLWLVKTIGVLIAVIGAALCLAGMRGDMPPPVVLLAVASAAGLAAVDVTYASQRVISPMYLMDALVEFVLIGWWLMELAAS